jgi:hypothetical protein
MIRRRLRTLEAAVQICASAVLARVVPVRWLIPRRNDSSAARAASRERATAVRGAIRSASARLPFRPKCLAQSLAAAAMLRRRGVPYRFNIGARLEKGFEAHAWVDAAGVVVAGEGDIESFTVLKPGTTAS